MNVIVTGVAGYIGGQIALQLKGAGHTVIGIDRRPLQKHQVGQLDNFLQADFDSDIAYKKLLAVNQLCLLVTKLIPPSLLVLTAKASSW